MKEEIFVKDSRYSGDTGYQNYNGYLKEDIVILGYFYKSPHEDDALVQFVELDSIPVEDLKRIAHDKPLRWGTYQALSPEGENLVMFDTRIPVFTKAQAVEFLEKIEA